MFELRHRELTFEAALRDLEHPDPRVRAEAAGALGHSPADRAEEAKVALRNTLDDGRPDVRYAAALSLGELQDREATARLILMLDDRDIMPRQAAAIALGHIGDLAAVEPLIRVLAEGPPDARFQATASLAELDGVRAVGPLIKALDDTDLEVRGSAAAALGDLKAHEAADALARLLDDKVEQVRVEAAYSLGRLDDVRALEPLAALTTHRDFGYMACERLGRMGDRRAIPALRKAWRSWWTHPVTKVRAAASLMQLGEGDLRTYLLRRTKSLRRDVRGLSLEMLGEVGGEWALPSLLGALSGPHVDAAVRGLGKLGNREAIEPLRAILARATDDPELIEDVREALQRLGVAEPA